MDHQQQTNDLVQLFSTTLTSLAVDAEAVRQATSLAYSTGVIGSKEIGELDQRETRQKLIELDQLVLGLEEKVVALRQIVSEEKRALVKFESRLHTEALEQSSVADQLVKAFEEVGVDAIQNSSQDVPNRRDSVDPRLATSNTGHSHSRNDENMPPDSNISLQRVSSEELSNYRSGNVMGRISLIDLNEALEEIEQYCQAQWKLISAGRQQQAATAQNPSLQRRHEYLQQRKQATQMDVHDNSLFVSEQELRENCAFFRHGESTARATLSALCSLKRLKQVPSKNQQVIYRLSLHE